MRTVYNTLLVLIFFCNQIEAQNVSFADTNFRNALLSHNPIIDTDGNDTISIGEAHSYTDSIIVINKNISSLSGLNEFTNLTVLRCDSNNITQLSILDNDSLRTVTCTHNNITRTDNQSNAIDIRYHLKLERFDCSHNQITTIWVPNSIVTPGVTSALKYLNCSYNQLIGFSSSISPLVELILSANPEIDNISCINCQLINIDVAADTSLETLDIRSGDLTTLDLSTNHNLRSLSCGANNITNLDLSSNNLLEILTCRLNALNGLNLSANPKLTLLSCSDNPLTSLDLSNNHSLRTLYATYCSLTELNLSNNDSVEILNCSNNLLTEINVSNLSALAECVMDFNTIDSVDVTNNSVLERLECNDNQLKWLNLRNNNNPNITSFDARNNSNLSCIQVDDEIWANTNWSNNIDLTASFSADCQSTSGFDDNLISPVRFYPNPVINELHITNINSFSSFEIVNTFGQIVKNMNASSGVINISNLLPGMYVINFFDKGQLLVSNKFVKV